MGTNYGSELRRWYGKLVNGFEITISECAQRVLNKTARSP
jgi:hypothetical protein